MTASSRGGVAAWCAVTCWNLCCAGWGLFTRPAHISQRVGRVGGPRRAQHSFQHFTARHAAAPPRQQAVAAVQPRGVRRGKLLETVLCRAGSAHSLRAWAFSPCAARAGRPHPAQHSSNILPHAARPHCRDSMLSRRCGRAVCGNMLETMLRRAGSVHLPARIGIFPGRGTRERPPPGAA